MNSEIESLKCALDTLRARRERMRVDLDELGSAISALEKELSRTPDFAGTRSVTAQESSARQNGLDSEARSKTIYSTMGVSDAVTDYLKRATKPQSPTTIMEGLQASGLQKESTNLYRLIYNTLWERSKRTNPDIRKVGKKWAYREPHAT